ncbi:MAG: 50S ribosomal protein L30e [Thermofilaceae archaeon]
MDIVREIQTALRTGKVVIGSKETLSAITNGRAKLVIVASNTPGRIRRDVEKYCKLSGTPLYEFPGTSWDLGAVCNKPFIVAAMAILDPGESNILDAVKG